MIKRTVIASFLFITFAFLYPIILTSSALAIESNCIVLNENQPVNNLPPHCLAGANGITYPPNLKCKPDGYCQMPPPTNAYTLYSCAGHRYGHKDLIGVLHTVAQRWKQKYPKGKLSIGDLNAQGHKSHNIGRAVDLDATTDGRDFAADFKKGNYNREATIEFGKIFVDTNLIENIWYNDQAVNAAVLKYARDTNKSKGMVMKYITGHDDHFHVDIKLKQKLPFWEPGC